ncbi:MAG: cupin domain-containing protein [Rhodospirillaceae bacterium]|jgi:quercetin dioxygenase-like cupin family protein|nr:cupin domain-containing protein [Rhodospirillaceae bacterium]MBT4490670.1 cupin domain-containing protein [Rhodospirillaceae bacterium]MBT5191507.1 cupin domain-containing protein [Rhodospirillaceae bacterium]MBT5894741.1 cupin domain-containing protein [Rhodospirillaceae bacterium]MBT6426812.1 cupin domain-containing protein [Rhodospirillaceae bacterium]
MALTDAITAMNFDDLIEFDKDARLVRKKLFQSDIVVCELVCYEPGQFTKFHVHPNQDEIFFCMDGEGVITFAEAEDMPIRKGSVVFVPKGTEHGVNTLDGRRLVVVFTKGPGLPNPRKTMEGAANG